MTVAKFNEEGMMKLKENCDNEQKAAAKLVEEA